MQLVENENKFDLKKIEEILRKENRFITNLLSIASVPERRDVDEESDNEANENKKEHNNKSSGNKTRAKSLQELELRLKAVTGNKKKLSYKEKLTKKNLKNRLKKKNKQDERNAKLKLERAAKLTVKNEQIDTEDNQVKEEQESNDTKKPIFNSENKLVYSKIDFANLGKKKHKKQEKNPKKLLEKLNEEKHKLEKLEQEGNIEEVVHIKEKTAWKNALAKAEGQKIKDDPLLLKKTVKRKEQKVRSSKKKWESRISGVEKAKDERQKKRKENLDKRKKDKKVKKMKNASKRGKIIPGF